MIEPINESSWGLNETYKGSLEPARCIRDLGSGQMSMMLVVQELAHSIGLRPCCLAMFSSFSSSSPSALTWHSTHSLTKVLIS